MAKGFRILKISLLLDIYLLRTSLLPPSGSSASILLASLRPLWLGNYSSSYSIVFSLLLDAKTPIFIV